MLIVSALFFLVLPRSLTPFYPSIFLRRCRVGAAPFLAVVQLPVLAVFRCRLSFFFAVSFRAVDLSCLAVSCRTVCLPPPHHRPVAAHDLFYFPTSSSPPLTLARALVLLALALALLIFSSFPLPSLMSLPSRLPSPFLPAHATHMFTNSHVCPHPHLHAPR